MDKVIIRDDGFAKDDFGDFVTLAVLQAGVENPLAVEIANDTDPMALVPLFPWISAIRIPFPSFADGRGFSLARRLRMLGFSGRLRAAGHVISDQYFHARRSGFDEVEIDALLARRQPQAQWMARSDWDRPTYQDRLRAAS
ncbi:MAG: DUF934 domain-containing protein [Paracoccaceae bacterium]